VHTDAFPTEYRGDAFATLHGSWNREERTGYKVIRARMKDGKPTGEFLIFAWSDLIYSVLRRHFSELISSGCDPTSDPTLHAAINNMGGPVDRCDRGLRYTRFPP
jgi:hypothetical protein